MTAVPVPSAPMATVAVVVPLDANVALPLVIVRAALVKGVPVTMTVRCVPAQRRRIGTADDVDARTLGSIRGMGGRVEHELMRDRLTLRDP